MEPAKAADICQAAGRPDPGKGAPFHNPETVPSQESCRDVSTEITCRLVTGEQGLMGRGLRPREAIMDSEGQVGTKPHLWGTPEILMQLKGAPRTWVPACQLCLAWKLLIRPHSPAQDCCLPPNFSASERHLHYHLPASYPLLSRNRLELPSSSHREHLQGHPQQ